MLISHRKHFIFTKTGKTAGTSVESYFEQYCMPDGEWQESHHGRDQYVSEAGIIGFRGGHIAQRKANPIWYNHMPARAIRNKIGQDIWERYFKFTVVRNPFDKLISGFFMYQDQKRKNPLRIDRRNPIHLVTGKTAVERFRCWIAKEVKLLIETSI